MFLVRQLLSSNHALHPAVQTQSAPQLDLPVSPSSIKCHASWWPHKNAAKYGGSSRVGAGLGAVERGWSTSQNPSMARYKMKKIERMKWLVLPERISVHPEFTDLLPDVGYLHLIGCRRLISLWNVVMMPKRTHRTAQNKNIKKKNKGNRLLWKLVVFLAFFFFCPKKVYFLHSLFSFSYFIKCRMYAYIHIESTF